jgi:hypothetical protein
MALAVSVHTRLQAMAQENQVGQQRHHSITWLLPCILQQLVVKHELLAGKYTPDGPKPTGPRGNIYAQKIREIQPLIETMRAVGQSRGKTPAQVGAAVVLCLMLNVAECITSGLPAASLKTRSVGSLWCWAGVDRLQRWDLLQFPWFT